MEWDSSLALHLREYWYIAAESRALGSRPVPRTILGERLVLFRQAPGRPAALIDRCAHRHMALSQGKVHGGFVECPYHGWRYDAQGRCVHIPSLRDGAKPPEIALRSYPAVESDDYVWVYMGSKPPSGPPRRFAHVHEPRWTTFHMKTRFHAAAISCLENFLDCPHTVYVHRKWFRSRDAREVVAQVNAGSDSIEVEFFGERDAQSLVSHLLFPSQRKMVHTDRFLMPSTSRVDYSFGPNRHFVITSQCTPVTEDETEVYTVITFRFGKIAPLVRLIFEPLARRIIRQDVRILAAQTEQCRVFGPPAFTSVETDLMGPQILRLWQTVAGVNGAETDLAPRREEIVLRF